MRQPKKEYSERFNQFVKIQNEHGLSNLQIDGIYVWRLIRGQFFAILMEDKNVIFKPESRRKSLNSRITMRTINLLGSVVKPSKWKQFPKTISNLKTFTIDLINSIPSIFFTAKLIFLGSQKSVFISAFIRNIGLGHRLTTPAEEKYKDDYILLDKPTAGLFSTHRLDTRAFNIIARRFFKAKINDDISPITIKISKAYGVETEIVASLIKKNIKTFKAHEAAFLHLFAKSNFKKLYLCWNRYYMALLSAAKKTGVKTSEFQHGTITPYHSMYSWEDYEAVPYSPDRLLCFGPSWPSQSKLAKSISPHIIGAPHPRGLQGKIRKYKAR